LKRTTLNLKAMGQVSEQALKLSLMALGFEFMHVIQV